MQHHEHLPTHVTKVVQQVFKTFICVKKVLMPIFLDIWPAMEDIDAIV
jgi:hypothetical protein